MIGFYDSGIGGWSIAQSFYSQFSFGFHYLADYDSLPLGDKSHDYITERIKKACEFLFSEGCTIVVLACNTASVHTIRHIQQSWLPSAYPTKQVLSITTPLVELVEHHFGYLKNIPGILMATPATIQTGFYQVEFKRAGFTQLQPVACPGLAEAIERADQANIQETILQCFENYQIPPDSLSRFIIPACTHYIEQSVAIDSYFEHNMITINPAAYTAKKLMEYVQNHPEFTVKQSSPHVWAIGKNSTIHEIQSHFTLPNQDIVFHIEPYLKEMQSA